MADPWAVVSSKPLEAKDPWAVVSSVPFDAADEKQTNAAPTLPGAVTGGLPIPGYPSAPVPFGLARRERYSKQRVLPSAQDERSSASADKLMENKSMPGAGMELLQTPVDVVRGIGNMGKGAWRVVKSMPTPAEPTVPNAPDAGGNWNEVAGGTAQALGGAMEAASPLIAAGVAEAPVATLGTLLAGAGAQKGAQAALENAPIGEGTKELASTLAAVAGGGLVGHPALRRLRGKPTTEALNAPTNRTETEPVAPRAAVPPAEPAQVVAPETTPVAAAELKSAQPEGRKGVIQQPTEVVSPRASVTPEEAVKQALAARTSQSDVPIAMEKVRNAAGLGKEEFDNAVMDLYKRGEISVDRHDAPYLVNDAERNSFVHAKHPGTGEELYYNGISWREGKAPDELPRKETTNGKGQEVGTQTPEAQGLLGRSRLAQTIRPEERGAVGNLTPLTPGQIYVREMVAKREAARQGPARKAADKTGEFYRDVKAKLVDSLAPVEDLIASAQKEHGYEIRPQYDFTNQADRVLRARSLAGRFVDEHGLSKVVQEVPDLEEFGQYLIAKHAKNVEADGFKTGRDLARDAALVQEMGPKYEPFAKRLQDYDKQLLDYTVDAGLISRELADRLRAIYPDYVPLQRVFAEIEHPNNVFAAGKGVANLSKQTVIEKLKGSEREIENPIGSLLNKTYAALQQGEKNKAARILASYQDLPGFEDLVNPRRRFRSGAESTFSYLDNGRKVTLRTTPEIASAVKSLDVQDLGALLKIVSGAARLFKGGTTGYNIPFFLANIARDQQTAFINSKNPFATSMLNQKLFWKSMWDVITHDNAYKEMVDQAAGGSSWDVVRQEPMKTVEKIRSERNLGTKLGYRAAHPLQVWRDFENVLARSEEYTRLQQYQGTKAELIREGRTPEDATILAAKAARENTANFSRRGEWGKVLNAWLPYFNASLQGSRAFLRSAERAPIQTFAKVATNVLFPVAITTLWNLSDPDREKAYRDIRKHEKDNTFLIIPPNPTQDDRGRWNVVKVPMDPGVGDLAIPLRRWIEQAHGLDPLKFREVAGAFISSLSPVNADWGSIKSNLTPQVTKPLFEDLTNQKFFTSTPIVPDSLKKLPPEQQIHPWTSGTARLAAKPLGISPIRVEEFVKGTMGGVGPQVLNLADNALAATGNIPWNQVGGQNPIEASESRFMKAAGGETQTKKYEEKAAADAAKDAKKHSPNQRLIGSMSLRDAIAQFAKMNSAEQAETRAILQKRLKRDKLAPYLVRQATDLGFTVR